LYEELEKFQPTLVKLAVELDENDNSIGEILKANDDCEVIMKKYKAVFDHTFSPDDALVNLNLLNDEATTGKSSQTTASTGANLVDDFLNLTSPTTTKTATESKSSSNKDLEDLFGSGPNLDELYKASKQQQHPFNLMVPMNNQNNISAPNIFDTLSKGNTDNSSNNFFMMSTSASLNSISQPVPTLQPNAVKTESNSSLSKQKSEV